MVSIGAGVRPVASFKAPSDRDVTQERQQRYADSFWNIAGRNGSNEGHCMGRCFIYRALMADVRIEPVTDCEGRVISKRSYRSRYVACDAERYVGGSQGNDALPVGVLQSVPVDLIEFLQGIEACPVWLIRSIHTVRVSSDRSRIPHGAERPRRRLQKPTKE